MRKRLRKVVMLTQASCADSEVPTQFDDQFLIHDWAWTASGTDCRHGNFHKPTTIEVGDRDALEDATASAKGAR